MKTRRGSQKNSQPHRAEKERHIRARGKRTLGPERGEKVSLFRTKEEGPSIVGQIKNGRVPTGESEGKSLSKKGGIVSSGRGERSGRKEKGSQPRGGGRRGKRSRPDGSERREIHSQPRQRRRE